MRQLTRRTSRRSLGTISLLAAVLALPVPAWGQWRVEPAVGMWRQEDRGQYTGRRVGQFVALQLSQQRGAGARITASAGYHRLDDALEVLVVNVTGQSRTDVYDAEIVSVLAGAAGDIWQGGAAAVSVGIEAGAGWNRDRFARSSGDTFTPPFTNPPTIDDWTPVFLAVPTLALRRAVGPRVELTASGRLLLGFGDMTPSTVPAVAVGVGYRF